MTMAQQPSEIKAHIKAEGESLREDLEEIQSRVKHALDWKVWYRSNTAVALGGAAAGGLLLALMFHKGRPTASEYEFIDTDDARDSNLEPGFRPSMRSTSSAGSKIHQVFDHTMSALFGVANDNFQDFMSKALPGFREHYYQEKKKRFD
jgi:hypothetical protein